MCSKMNLSFPEYYFFLYRYLPNIFKSPMCDKCVKYWENEDGLDSLPLRNLTR